MKNVNFSKVYFFVPHNRVAPILSDNFSCEYNQLNEFDFVSYVKFLTRIEIYMTDRSVQNKIDRNNYPHLL